MDLPAPQKSRGPTSPAGDTLAWSEQREAFLQQARILIIDDEADIVELFRRTLALEGYREIRSTVDPLVAIRMFGEFQPDLVILDWHMPGLAGRKVLEALRAIVPAEVYLPILVVTSDVTIESRREALDRGGTDFLSKPFDLTEFLSRIANLVETCFLQRQALQKATHFRRSALDALSSHVAILNERGTIVEINAAWARLVEPDDGGKGWPGVGVDYVASGDSATAEGEAPGLSDGIRAVRARQLDEFQIEYPCHTPREQRWFLARVTRFPGEGAVPMVVVQENITSRRQAQEALRQGEERFRQMALATNDAVWEWDLVTNAVSWNEGYEKLFSNRGREVTQTLESWVDDIHPEDVQRVVDGIYRAIEEGSVSWTDEYQFRREDGTYAWVMDRGQVIRDLAGKAVRMVGGMTDLTERHRTEEELRWKTAFLEAQVDSSPDGVLVVDPKGEKILQNQRFVDLLQVPPSVAASRDNDRQLRWAAATIKDPERFVEKVEYLYARPEESGRDEIELRDGTTLDRYSAPVIGRDGQHYGRIWLFRDVTQRKRAELEIERLNTGLEERVAQRTEELLAATEEAEHANSAKSAFLSRISHELRTPLNTILGFGELLETEESLSSGHLQNVKQILRSGRHLLSLIDEVLDISSADSGRLMLALEAVEVGSLLEETLCLLRSLSAARGVALVSTCPPGCSSTVLADPQRLKRVLLSLLAGALKSNRPGTVISIQCVQAEVNRAPGWRLSFVDTRPGLDAEQVAFLFTPFDRPEAESTEPLPSGGDVGFAFARRMVELMGGKMGVESNAGEGCTCWIDLPAAQGTAEEQSRPAASASELDATEPRPQTLLFVEDQARHERLITRILGRRPGLRVHTAGTAALGLSMAQSLRPDLILLDFHLPGNEGVQVLAQLRSDSRTAEIPVVSVGGEDRPGEPLDARSVLRTVDRYLGSASELPS